MTSSKGLVAGDLSITMHDGSRIDCKNSATVTTVLSQMNQINVYWIIYVLLFIQGTLIPCLDKEIKEINVNASLVLIVEKDCTFQRLIDDNFLKMYPVVLVTVTI